MNKKKIQSSLKKKELFLVFYEKKKNLFRAKMIEEKLYISLPKQ